MRAGWRSWGVIVSVLVFGGVGSGGQAIGCAGFGQISGTEDDLGEGSCERSRDALSFFAEGTCCCVVQCLNVVATERRDVVKCLAHDVDAWCGVPSMRCMLASVRC